MSDTPEGEVAWVSPFIKGRLICLFESEEPDLPPREVMDYGPGRMKQVITRDGDYLDVHITVRIPKDAKWKSYVQKGDKGNG